ncbi:hypothetical protein CPU12_00225 [Malaciobacter molluscorum LMG 25693]|uniref:Small multi-drug export protein n=1 Tax=Malaciobacter molluscorum LMG 25693 TaxID=870501 RepID=A0A2G1DL47_9BACT|nr:small multi-drug export protein [Malaciobacter molluscorum]AXX92010.1 putative small multi-drug export protein [Malaciobacter molluscorum LMG 25693]PHO19243.1 hypothetical protein CPU12_00225 [Malaciobacter molluscorum LMG 25693]RXJ96493.1 hypothetical protein CRV00_02440 [Malaciobacter molluscorum]
MIKSNMKNIFKLILKEQLGTILILCLLLTLILVCAVLLTYLFDAKLANKITSLVISNIFVGRVPSLSLGYAYNLPNNIVIPVNIITELILVTLIYPLFIFSFKGILKIKILEDFFSKINDKKHQHQESFKKYGKIGLFIFVFIPFWMTGPIVGAIIGYLIGLKHYVTIFIVFVATCFAISLWGLFLNEIVSMMISFDKKIIWITLLIFVVIILINKIRKLFSKRNKK